MTVAVRDAIGYKILEEETKFKVTSIRYKFPQIFDWLNLQDTNVWIILALMLLVMLLITYVPMLSLFLIR